LSPKVKVGLGLFGLAVLGFIIIQFIPVGRIFSSLERDENPPVLVNVAWDSPETERLVRAACFDCHSNETVWPWYSNIAPVSWLITRDVNKGRDKLNFSEPSDKGLDINNVERHLNSDMPLWYYLPLHPDANLSDAQKAQLVAGLRATFGSR
jgi:Haem-binding domain